MEQAGQVCGDNDSRRYIEQMVGELFKSRLVGNLVSLFDVTFKNILDKRTNIAFVIFDGQ